MTRQTFRSYLLLLILPAILWAGFPAFGQVNPPRQLNYQGVLRDDTGQPVSGDQEMLFTFWSHETSTMADSEILTDNHPLLTVTDGLFSVRLGGGTVTDGAGPGRYETLGQVFRDFNEVWMEIAVRGDPLTPRVRIAASAYALNADHLDGLDSNDFALDVHTHSGGDISGAVANATNAANADQLDGIDSTGFATASHGHDGSEITGSVGNADNADQLDGLHAADFLRSNTNSSFDSATLRIASGATLDVVGTFEAAAWADRDDAAFVMDPNGTSTLATVQVERIEDRADTNLFLDPDGALSMRVAGNVSIGYGDGTDDDYLYFDNNAESLSWNNTATRFNFSDDVELTGGLVAEGSAYGVSAGGTSAGGYFYDPADTGYAYLGYGDRGIEAYGSNHGGYFEDTDNGGYAYIGYGPQGIEAYGSTVGGAFRDSDGTGYARAGYGDRGVEGYGDDMGGYFEDLTSGSYVELGSANVAVTGSGSTTGAFLSNSWSDGFAYVAYQDQGIWASGSGGGGYFEASDSSGYASIGKPGTGIEAFGDTTGGYFEDTTSSTQVTLAKGSWALSAIANQVGMPDPVGAKFEARSTTGDVMSHSYIAYGEEGIRGFGYELGGYFADMDSSAFGWVGYDTYKIYGTGSVNFVQNHPEEQDKVIVYTAPEGDEVATYTRGSARLENGEAVVTLGETFQWVTNPDLGLTAHVTPRGPDTDLYVYSLSTTELVVRADADSVQDARFDYIVYGLRIGFEETSVVQMKEREAYIPSMASHRELYSDHPELRRFNARERFVKDGVAMGILDLETRDMNGAASLRAAVQEYDPKVHGPVADLRHRGDMAEGPGEESSSTALAPNRPADRPAGSAGPSTPGVAGAVNGVPMDDDGNVYARSFRPSASDLATLVPVAGDVTAGDVLVIDRANPGMLKTGDSPADSTVFGIVAAEPGVILGSDMPGEGAGEGAPEVPVTLSGVSLCKVDAGYGAILPGDLLTTSPTSGHAMRADDPLPGTIVGKALEPLEYGTGLVRVLVTLR